MASKSVRNKVKLGEVARAAGVSTATVSRVLNNHPVSGKARRVVEEAVAKLDYRPNLLARGLSKGRSGQVGVVVSTMENPYFSSIMNAMEIRFRRDGIICNFASSSRRGDEEVEILQRFLNSGIDGLVVVDVGPQVENSGFYAELNRHVPLVLIHGNPQRTDSNLIMMDQKHGMHLVMDRLLELGHRKIAMIASTKASFAFTIKESVYRDRLKEAGIEVREDFFIRVDDVDHFDTINLTSQVCALSLGGKDPPTAVFASNELMAIGVLNAARQLRLEVPRDLSVITQDNTMLSHISVPRLTTVDMKTSLLGAEAAQMMCQILESGNRHPRRLVFYPELIVRDSCGSREADK